MRERNTEDANQKQKKWYTFQRKIEGIFRVEVEAYSKEQAERFVSGLSVENTTANRGWEQVRLTDTTQVLTWEKDYGISVDYRLNEEGQEIPAEEEDTGDVGDVGK